MFGNLQLGEVRLEIIEEVGEWDYSWHIGALMRTEDGRLFYAEDSGCSCYGYGDSFTSLDDLTSVKSWQEAVELSKKEFSDSDVVSFAERLVKQFM